MENISLAGVEPEMFRQFTQINLGDSTMLATLHSLGRGATTVVLDQNMEAFEGLLHELKNGVPVFGFLKESKRLYYYYASIVEKILNNKALTEEMQRVYEEAWAGAKDNLGSLYVSNSTIEDNVASVDKPKPIADLITYYYPSPATDPVFKALDFAGLFLKPGGEFVVASENKNVTDAFTSLGGEFVTKSGFVKRSGPYLSAYDIAWGQQGRYEVHIKNKSGRLHEHINTMKSSLAFRVMGALGMMK